MLIAIGDYKVKSLKQMQELGRRLAGALEPGDVLALDGDMGAGKTTLTGAIASGLGITEIVTSPTFALAQSYVGRDFALHHMDAYRLDGAGDFVAAGLAELLDDRAVVVIEWAERVPDFLPDRTLFVRIFREAGGQEFEQTASGQVIISPDTGHRVLRFSSRSAKTADRFRRALYDE